MMDVVVYWNGNDGRRPFTATATMDVVVFVHPPPQPLRVCDRCDECDGEHHNRDRRSTM
jgi:hypothetical protein